MGLLLLKRTILYGSLPSPLPLQISTEGESQGGNSIKKSKQISQMFSIKAILVIYKPVLSEVKGNG